MERINGSITSAIKSRSSPDENIGTILELDIQSSLLPFVMPGMQTVFAKKAYADADGRLLMHKVFRDYVKNPAGFPDEAEWELGEGSDEETFVDQGRAGRKKELQPNKLPPSLIESFITSSVTGEIDFEAVDLEQLRYEFEVADLTSEDIRRALCRIGDVMLVDKVKIKMGQEVLDVGAFTSLRAYIKSYLKDVLDSSIIDGLFDWDGESQVGKPLLHGRLPLGITVTKWKNVRFETIMKMADYRIDSRSVRICGSQYERSTRKRSVSFFEFSTDTSLKSGAHTAGSMVERASTSRSDYTREFAEALFFVTVDFDWSTMDLESANTPSITSRLPRTFFLCYSHPISTRREDGLTIFNRVTPSERIPMSKTRNRLYKTKKRWLDVDDFVDLIGMIYCKGEEYVCWRDASWDPYSRKGLDPIRWNSPVGDDGDDGDDGMSRRRPVSEDQADNLNSQDLVDMRDRTTSSKDVPVHTRRGAKRHQQSSEYNPEDVSDFVSSQQLTLKAKVQNAGGAEEIKAEQDPDAVWVPPVAPDDYFE
ncbi:hypothetical protein BJ508DRAFT_336096 [Ascobolus immersus RN42]|uniref:Uncharacterized protein n=1 Tax=Ascobolus immersus RN42 TaxID=1160509 RepID=A0A3N4HH28_ASCIM|nr:hypothetical protein BJ508DRAFT_336096 [Ascobolus immersus RN42]